MNIFSNRSTTIIIKDTHRGLFYSDGVLQNILHAGYFKINRRKWLDFKRRPKEEIVLVDIRERDLTIKGQEILTADKVAIRVSIIVQYKVTDPQAAIHAVESYADRLYSDVQLAARRSLASMDLETILTNRNQLSDDIMSEVKEAAAGYGVAILRANVKDIVFPGNLQDIMNRVLTAERLSQAQLIEARTKAEVSRIGAEADAEVQRLDAETDAESQRRAAENAAEVRRIQTEAEIKAWQERAQAANAFTENPALLRLIELETLRELGISSNARLYINFDHAQSENGKYGVED